MEKLPMDVINHILSYNKHFRIRKGKIVNIIPKDDERINILMTIPIFKTNYIFIKKEGHYDVYIDSVPCRDYFIWRMVVCDTLKNANKIYSYVIK